MGVQNMARRHPQEILYALLQVYNEDGSCVNPLASNLVWFVILMRGIIGIIAAVNFTQNIDHQLLKSFCGIFQGALLEIWKHMTRENLNTIVALAILVYTLPDILDVVKELMKKNVVLWGSKSTLKG